MLMLYFLTGLMFKSLNRQMSLSKGAKSGPRAFVARGKHVEIASARMVRNEDSYYIGIATRCVIAAGEVTEPYTIVPGAPAKQIGRRKPASK